MRAIVHDVTERKPFETKMQQAQKLESLGLLAGGIAHDFNNLPAAVLGHAELALAELHPASAARESMEQIEKAGLHAAELTRQMLAYAGRGSMVVQRVAIQDVVRDKAQLLGSSISRSHTLTLDLPEALPAVMADPAQLRQIVMNLVINASEAIGEREGVITVRAAALDPGKDLAGDIGVGNLADGRHVLLEVTDTGDGMDGEATLRGMRKVSPDLPVVLCSGYDVVESQERLADLRVSGFLHKPFRLAELQRVLRHALGE
jgi:signal transduction histidine kinase